MTGTEASARFVHVWFCNVLGEYELLGCYDESTAMYLAQRNANIVYLGW